MRSVEIREAIKEAGLSQTAIAKEINRSEPAVSLCINKKMVSNFIMTAVANSIGCRVEDVFSEYFSGHRYGRTSQAALQSDK